MLNTRITGQETGLPTINYYGNVDKLLASNRSYFLTKDTSTMGYPIFKGIRKVMDDKLSLMEYGDDGISVVYAALKQEDSSKIIEHILISSGLADQLGLDIALSQPILKEAKIYQFGIDPILMKYKSTPHAVLSLKYVNANTVHILPTGTISSDGGSKIYIVPSVRTKSSLMKEKNSTFLCPTNTVMTGRYHTGDEKKGKTQYEYATLKAVDANGKTVSATISVSDVQWSDAISEFYSNFKAPANRVIVGRKHSGDEHGNTQYATAQIKVNGETAILQEYTTSSSIKESGGIWFNTDSYRVMTGRKHDYDENGQTTYTSAKATYTDSKSVNISVMSKIDYNNIVPFWDNNQTLSTQ